MTASFSDIPSNDITLSWSVEPDVTVSVYFGNVVFTDDETSTTGVMDEHPEWYENDTNNVYITWGDNTSSILAGTESDFFSQTFTHRYEAPGVYTIKVEWLSIDLGYYHRQASITHTLDFSSSPEWSLGWQTQVTPQPLIGGNDGFGALRGSTLRRDLIQPFPEYDGDTGTYGPLPPTEVVVHQMNTAQANPEIYLPSKTVVAGQQWRMSCDVTFDPGTAVAGITQFKWSVDWYSSSGTYISSTDGEWVSQASDMANTSPVNVYVQGWRPKFAVTVPAGATKMTPTFQMKTLNPVNAWAPRNFKYERLITS
jgi:hypothetical protein